MISGSAKSHSEEDPLQHLTVVVWVIHRIEPEFIVLVVVLSQVQQYRGTLKDIEIVARAISYRRDAAIWVQLDKPRLFLHVCRKVDWESAARCVRCRRLECPYL